MHLCLWYMVNNYYELHASHEKNGLTTFWLICTKTFNKFAPLTFNYKFIQIHHQIGKTY